MFLIKLILAVISIYLPVIGYSAEEFKLAFVASMYTQVCRLTEVLLDKRMQNVTWNLSFWNQFLGFVGGRRYVRNPDWHV